MPDQEASGPPASLEPAFRNSATPDAPVPGIAGDIAGGVSAAMVALPHALGMGTLVFLPLGNEHIHIGLVAGLYAAIAGGFVAALAGSARFQIYGPRASTSVILASLVAVLAANPLFNGAGAGVNAVAAGTIATLVFLTVLLGGLIQILFAGMRLGRALKFIPHPVLAGFMYGVAVLIVLKQVAPLLGIPSSVALGNLQGHAGDIKPLALTVGLITVLAALWAPRLSQTLSPHAALRIPRRWQGCLPARLRFCCCAM